MEQAPSFLTLRQAAKRGPLSEHRLRLMVAQGMLPGFYAGNRFLVNYPRMLEMLDKLSVENLKKE